jgi:hypothetical protein
MKKLWWVILGLSLVVSSAANFAAPAFAQQTCPAMQTEPGFNSPGTVFGYLASQWKMFFGIKTDATNGCATNLTLIDPTIVGGTSPLQAIGANALSVVATGPTATLNATTGKITTASLSTAAGSTYTLTLTNSVVAVGDLVFASVQNGTNTAGIPTITTVSTSTANQIAFTIHNSSSSAAFNGSLVISFLWVPFG